MPGMLPRPAGDVPPLAPAAPLAATARRPLRRTVAPVAELAPHVRVNPIAPSLARTPVAEPLTRNAAVAEAIARQRPILRLGERAEGAALADVLPPGRAGRTTGRVPGAGGGGRATLWGRE
jgi:NAD(P)-dependent dehydrogenase (short-subunit alcohol dehydrogenase family)